MISKYFKPEDFKLCYIKHNYAYFTTKDLKDQWGDDWDDAPYEHNAGHPYGPHKSSKEDWNEDGSPKWEIIDLIFTGPFDAPCDHHSNSPYSVDDINRGAIAWLKSSSWSDSKIIIHAGTSIADFFNKIRQGGGEIYFPASWLFYDNIQKLIYNA